jgi:hypothetical protein
MRMSELGPIDAKAFKGRVLGAERPVVVGFIRPKVANVEQFSTELERLAEAHADRLDFAWVDLSTAKPAIKNWLAPFGLTRAPRTYLVFRGGQIWTRCWGNPFSARLIVERTLAALDGDQAALASPLAEFPHLDDAGFEAEFDTGSGRSLLLVVYTPRVVHEAGILQLAKQLRGLFDRHGDDTTIRLVDLEDNPMLAARFNKNKPVPRYIPVVDGAEHPKNRDLLPDVDAYIELLGPKPTPVSKARPALDEVALRAEAAALRELLEARLPDYAAAREAVELPAQPPASALQRTFWAEIGWHACLASLELLSPSTPDGEAMVVARLREHRSAQFRVSRKQLPDPLRLIAVDDDGVGFVIANESTGEDNPPVLIVLYDSGEIAPAGTGYLEWCANALVRRAFRGAPTLDVRLPPPIFEHARAPLPRLSPQTRELANGLWQLPSSAAEVQARAGQIRITAADVGALLAGLAALDPKQLERLQARSFIGEVLFADGPLEQLAARFDEAFAAGTVNEEPMQLARLGAHVVALIAQPSGSVAIRFAAAAEGDIRERIPEARKRGAR